MSSYAERCLFVLAELQIPIGSIDFQNFYNHLCSDLYDTINIKFAKESNSLTVFTPSIQYNQILTLIFVGTHILPDNSGQDYIYDSDA